MKQGTIVKDFPVPRSSQGITRVKMFDVVRVGKLGLVEEVL